MTQFLPPNLLALFAARDPIPYLPPVSKLSHEKRTSGYTGVGPYLRHLEDPADAPPAPKVETREERLERKRREKAEQVAYKLEQEIAVWNPNGNVTGTTEPFKTLFVGRINYDTSESKLKREFEVYGTIKKINMVHNTKTGKPRGYAFVEYEHERDMRSAFKHADGKKIDGRRVLVDVERGRTVKGWLPRRLGGGLGGTRRGGPEVNVKISGREDAERDRFRDKDVSERGGRDERGHNRREKDRSRERSPDTSRHRDRDRDRDNGRRGEEGGRVGRERDRGDRDNKDKDKPERRRSRDRERGERKKRKRSRSPSGQVQGVDKRRSRSRDRKDKDIGEDGEEKPRKRSRSREKKRHRSKSREKERKREKRDKDRDRDKDRGKDRFKTEDMDRIRIKEEPVDDGYAQYEENYNQDYNNYIKQEDADGDGDEEGQVGQNHDGYDGYDGEY